MSPIFPQPARRPIAAAILLMLLAGQGAIARAPAMSQPVSPVAAVAAASDDIRDIRGPKSVTSAWLIPLLAIGTLLATGGGYAAWRWTRRRRNLASKLPSAIALERLERARALMQPTGGREFSIEVSDIVREYIESRFQVMAAHLTTHEFLHVLLEAGDSRLVTHHELLGDFLQSCDLAKFGGWNLRPENMEAMLQSAQRFVIESAQPVLAKTSGLNSAPSLAGETYDSVPST